MDYSIYFVPTPIGNLEDITVRALNVLKSVDIILCEDTRESMKLLNYYNIKKTLDSYHKFNESKKSDIIIEKVKEGKVFAVITDQGMPGISDPGHILIKKCVENDVKFTILPGASSILTALVGSAFDNDEFSYYGFIPKKNSDKKQFYIKLKEDNKTSIFFDTPHNLKNTIKDLKEIFPKRYMCIARELTKKFEEYKRFKIEDINIDDLTLKGEFVVILSKNEKIKKESVNDYKNEIISMKNEGLKTKEIVKSIQKISNLPKNLIYDYIISLD